MQVEKTKPPVVDEILNQLSEDYGLSMERPGIHCTETIYCLRKAFWNKTDPIKASPQETLYFLFGLGLQDALIKSCPSQPIIVDGIWMSPDYYKDDVLAELKTTMIGQKRLDAYDFPEGWVKQLMCYCYGYKVNRAVLIVVTLIRRELFTYVLSFTDEELCLNWSWILGRAFTLRTSLDSNLVPDEQGSDWECNSCRYRLRCSLLNIKEVRGEK